MLPYIRLLEPGMTVYTPLTEAKKFENDVFQVLSKGPLSASPPPCFLARQAPHPFIQMSGRHAVIGRLRCQLSI